MSFLHLIYNRHCVLNLLSKEPACKVCADMSKQKSKNKSKSDDKPKNLQETSPITTDKSDNIIINILAKPGAKQNNITDITQEGVAVQINAPPTEGEANTELIKYISSVLAVKKSDLTLERGFKSRQKVLKLTGNRESAEDVLNKFKKEMSNQ